jgi:hypothetical protein
MKATAGHADDRPKDSEADPDATLVRVQPPAALRQLPD